MAFMRVLIARCYVMFDVVVYCITDSQTFCDINCHSFLFARKWYNVHLKWVYIIEWHITVSHTSNTLYQTQAAMRSNETRNFTSSLQHLNKTHATRRKKYCIATASTQSNVWLQHREIFSTGVTCRIDCEGGRTRVAGEHTHTGGNGGF